MSSTGAGYDLSCSQFSPDGRIFQVEYAAKAVESSGTAIGLRCKDGIVLAVEKPQVSKMLVSGSNRRIFGVNSKVGAVITGFPADGRQIVHRAREEAKNYEETYGHSIIPSVLANRLALYMHYFTIHYSLRPFGAAILFVGYDEDTKSNELYMVDPAGLVRRYFGCAAGKGSQAANTEIEKLYGKTGGINGITCREALGQLAQILYTVRDSTNDKPFELEMAWCLESNQFQFSHVPADLIKEADDFGKQHGISVKSTTTGNNATTTETETVAPMDVTESVEENETVPVPMDE